MNLSPYVSIWVVLAVEVLALGGYRILIARRNDESLDVMEKDGRVIEEQKRAYKKIVALDRWGQSLTILTIAYGLVIVIVHLANVWQESSKITLR